LRQEFSKMQRVKRLLLLAACAAVGAGCGGASAPKDGAHFAVTAQVIDSETGRPVPAKTPKRPVPELSAVDKAAPILRKLEPLPEPAQDPGPGPNSPAARPQLSPEEETLLGVARERPFVPVESRVGGQPAVMNFVGGDEQCRTVAVTYPARRVAELWRVCADGQFALDREAEAIPDLPEDPGLRAARQATMHWAFANGRADSTYGELIIRAQSSGQRDQNGCTVIRSAVTWNGVTIGMSDETICLGSE
jgi:hypothetical protein